MAHLRTWAWWVTHPVANWDLMLGDIKYTKTKIVAAYERARFGWSKWDIHGPGFDGSVMPAIGHQLVYFADATIAWPGEVGSYPDIEQWRDELRKHGQALIDASEDPEMPQVLVDHYNLVDFVESENNSFFRMVFPEETPEVIQAKEEFHAEQLRRQNAAKEAFIWFSENYGSLWD